MSFTALVVDDDSGFRGAFQAFFSDWTVEAAEDGEVAKKILESKTFDVVVLDRNMPKVKGNEVLLWMSSRAEHQYACTIMCTAFGELGEAIEALKLGAWNYVSKPVTELKLLQALLLPGIAFKRCNKARSELFAAPDLETLFEKLSSVCNYAVGPEGGIHLLLVSPSGDILHSEGTVKRSEVKPRHAFVDRVIKGGEAWLFSETATETAALEPILPNSKTLAAVAVRGIGGQILGVLDMEAGEEYAFGPAWREVLRYIADLVAIHRVNEIRAQQIASTMIYREIRHRIATHAQVVSMQTNELLETKNGAPLDPRRLRIIKRNADTIDSIVRELRDVADEQKPKWTERSSVSEIINDSVEQSAAKHAKDNEPKTSIEFYKQPFEGLIRAAVPELKYSLECVLDNAWEAIAERYRQDPDCKESWEGVIRVCADKEGSGIAITVSDNGIGFEPRESELLFSPLYSKKTRMMLEGTPRNEKGAERIARVLNSVGWALSIDKEIEDELDDKDMAGAEITIRDELNRASINIKHPGLKNGSLSANQFIGRRRSDENRGIGLFSARKTILQHGGHIQANSEGVFQGATFKIWLPNQA